LRLRVTTPTRVAVDREVTYVQAEDPTGRFGILPGHERFLTPVVPCVLVYRWKEDGTVRESYVAVRQGVLRITPDGVDVAVRDAHRSDDLAGVRDRIRQMREGRSERAYRSTRSIYQMQLNAWRRLMEFEDVRTR